MTLKINAHFFRLHTGELACELYLPGDKHGRGSDFEKQNATFLDSWELDLSGIGFFARKIVKPVLSYIGHDAEKMKQAARIVLSLYEKGYMRGQQH